MNKRRLHHVWVKMKPLNPWYFLVIALISGTVTIFALRHNNQTALQLRNDVLTADKQNGDVEGALRKLREYIYAHMNTNLASGPNAIKPPIQLKYRYERLVAAEKVRIDAANAQIYTQAQAFCEQQNPNGFSGRGRVPCIQDYVSKHGVQEQPIPDSLYKFDFVSPFWSPDLAGWSLIIAITSGAIWLMLFSLDWWLKRELRE